MSVTEVRKIPRLKAGALIIAVVSYCGLGVFVSFGRAEISEPKVDVSSADCHCLRDLCPQAASLSLSMSQGIHQACTALDELIATPQGRLACKQVRYAITTRLQDAGVSSACGTMP